MLIAAFVDCSVWPCEYSEPMLLSFDKVTRVVPFISSNAAFTIELIVCKISYILAISPN